MNPSLSNLSHTVRRLPPFVAFAIVGGAGFGVNELCLFIGLHFFGLDALIAALLAFFVTVTFTWYGNRTLTFHGSVAMDARAMVHEWVRFVLVNSIGLAANYATFAALVDFGPSPLSSPYVALAIGSVVGLVFNFYSSQRGVFRG